jgi:hypothetical protein
MIRRRAAITALAVAGLMPLISVVTPCPTNAQAPTCYTKAFSNGLRFSSCPRGTPPNKIPGITLSPRAEPGTFGANRPNSGAFDVIIDTYQVGDCAAFWWGVAESAAAATKRIYKPLPYVDPLTCGF